MSEPNRQLAAIVIADAVGYSQMIQADETGTRTRFNELAEGIFKPLLAQYRGRLMKTKDDAFLITFNSAVAAVSFAADVQRILPVHQSQWPDDHRIRFRIGVNLGEVIVEGDDVHGDGVNVAARLEAVADPGGILITGNAYEQVRRRMDQVAFEDVGPQDVPDYPGSIPAYRVLLDPDIVDQNVPRASKSARWQVVFGLAVLVVIAGAALWTLQS
ncbi:MAG: adenylate/guanylate cyclase domain-containing protein [Rhodospirillaceae bacterium]|jgi:adenylate cyclase|nr:adenylate/guanylate cyclase domain-containing protein [Rhodospirillaceae bacterium]MBT4043415.1 adenylate/guanylate cyclase domain-containing protein [Rhodospirillaceae bacterium]MBT4686885.1 adenylate/guanylate cyclase domain-containing protein [Rhodospirillaceae bacterium]MBT5081869.1 adenylate/guanylate cyclase domain-containing protein [Rhodospirillaceae bacterium]MBT5524893.1 adenylate/guanylate cyclase domain-containing protein [Rhodospirillaceae bacterium]